MSIKFRDPSVLNFKPSEISKKNSNHEQVKSIFKINFKANWNKQNAQFIWKLTFISNVLHTVLK